MVDLTVLGDVNVDVITSPIIKFPKRDSQITVDSIGLSPGGSSFNVAITCANLGLKTRFIGKLGKDVFSDYLLDFCRSVGIESRIKIDENSKTGSTLAVNFRNGDRSFVTFRGSNNVLNKRDFDLKEIDGKILSVSGFNLLDGLRHDLGFIFDHVKKRGMMTALDPNWDPLGWSKTRLKQLHEVLLSTDLFFPDFDEGKKISGKRSPKKIIEKLLTMGPKIVCLKLGKKGCMIGNKDIIMKVPTVEVKPINTVGPGDVFTAVFLKSYLEGNSLYYCGRFASVLASISTTKTGLDRYPKKGEVDSWLRQYIGKDWKKNMTRS